MRHYHSKHFWWDNDMDKEFRTRIEGELSIARWRTKLKAGVENIKNYTYFNQQALPEQKAEVCKCCQQVLIRTSNWVSSTWTMR